MEGGLRPGERVRPHQRTRIRRRKERQADVRAVRHCSIQDQRRDGRVRIRRERPPLVQLPFQQHRGDGVGLPLPVGLRSESVLHRHPRPQGHLGGNPQGGDREGHAQPHPESRMAGRNESPRIQRGQRHREEGRPHVRMAGDHARGGRLAVRRFR